MMPIFTFRLIFSLNCGGGGGKFLIVKHGIVIRSIFVFECNIKAHIASAFL
jgi:hypothetical protein